MNLKRITCGQVAAGLLALCLFLTALLLNCSLRDDMPRDDEISAKASALMLMRSAGG